MTLIGGVPFMDPVDIIAVVKAADEGKTIQFCEKDVWIKATKRLAPVPWIDCGSPNWAFDRILFREKPVPRRVTVRLCLNNEHSWAEIGHFALVQRCPNCEVFHCEEIPDDK